MSKFKESTQYIDIKNMTYTEREIWSQPSIWERVYEQVRSEKQSIITFVKKAVSTNNLNIVLTGAGSSAFIGLSLIGAYKRNLKTPTIAVSTTDIVTHPLQYFSADVPVLLISFARSGNSPESVATTRIVDQICKKVYHLIITCDASGDLAGYVTDSPKYVFTLPAEANDKSLAMTSSYSGMLLTGLLISKIYEIDTIENQVKILAQYGQELLDQSEVFKQIAEMNFERSVFLGSGPLFGTATESHLKLQELTDGEIICKNDSFLGFRHGPKAVINSKTLVFLLFSNQDSVKLYETDLIISLSKGKPPLYTVGFIESGTIKAQLDKVFVLSPTGSQLEEEFLAICFILPAQMIGFYKSVQLGMNPDNPSLSGAISRVVEGVKIYPYKCQIS